jgi:hypothetical protein
LVLLEHILFIGKHGVVLHKLNPVANLSNPLRIVTSTAISRIVKAHSFHNSHQNP